MGGSASANLVFPGSDINKKTFPYPGSRKTVSIYVGLKNAGMVSQAAVEMSLTEFVRIPSASEFSCARTGPFVNGIQRHDTGMDRFRYAGLAKRSVVFITLFEIGSLWSF